MLYHPINVDHPLCVFISLGNTGANSLFRTLSQNLPQKASDSLPGTFDDSKGPSPETLMNLSLLYGHRRIFECETLNLCETLKRNFELITLVRDPIKHFLTHYNWCLGYYSGSHFRWTDAPDSGWMERRDRMPKEWLKSLESINSFIKYYEENPKNSFSLISQIKNVALRETEKNLGNLAPGDIVRLLFERFRFVGITELFEETVFSVCKLFNWPMITEPWVRLGPYRPKLTINNMNETQILRIKRILSEDIKVYNVIRKKFEDNFCGQYTLEQYSDYKANCIAADQQICTNFLLGSDEYIPKKFFLEKNKMTNLKFSVLSSEYNFKKYLIGDKYLGEYKNYKKHGKGTDKMINGTIYIGEFREDKRHGQGILTMPDGLKYIGQFKNDNPNGHGTMTVSNGMKYVGEFKDGNPIGHGILTPPEGSMIEGFWENNQFKKTGTVI